MSRISEQGQTPSEEAADDLHRREARGQDEYHRQRAAVPVTRVHLVVVFVMAHGTILSPRYCHGWFAEGGYRPVVLALRQPDAEDNLTVPSRRIRFGFSAKRRATLRTLEGPNSHSSECSLGKITSTFPSPTVRIAKVSFSLRVHTPCMMTTLLTATSRRESLPASYLLRCGRSSG